MKRHRRACEAWHAVTVIAVGAHRYVLVGYLSVAALRALGRDVALAVCVELSEADALMAHRRGGTRAARSKKAGC